ncbi:MAG TPA: response regulator [Bacteroidota bacterium]|nr:response regulator [Bacteroidota bacterium]
MEKILVIDDDEMDLDLMRILMQHEGYDVISTADGPQGIELYKQHQPSLVFLDLGLPSMSGMEVLRQIRSINEDAKIVLITGYGSIEHAVEAMRGGAIDFVEKTYDTGRMISRIKTILEAFA